jgi:hypothetical protein
MTRHGRTAPVDRASTLPTDVAPAPAAQRSGPAQTVEALALDRGRDLLALGVTTALSSSLCTDPPIPGQRGSGRRARSRRGALG